MSTSLDGLPTEVSEAPLPADPAPTHPNGAVSIDHVVVMTPDLERSVRAFEAAGLSLRRIREAGTPEEPVRQAFFRTGEVILEVVGPAGEEGAARFWGLVVVVSDLEAAAAGLGDRVGTVRDAVQPGRRIATVRPSAGLGVPVALMSAPPARA
jgi:catechol 2,3-dioxygenase-like lactoylglutathione lyase family enzyme